MKDLGELQLARVHPTPRFTGNTRKMVPDRNMVSQRPIAEDDEEILEIPRSAFRPTHGFNYPPFSPRNGFRPTPIVIEMKIDSEMMNMMMEIGTLFLAEILQPRLTGPSSGMLKKF